MRHDLVIHESDAARIDRFRLHEFANGFDQLLNVAIVAFQAKFEFDQLGFYLPVRDRGFAQVYESAYHEDAHFDGAFGVQNGRGHDGAVLGKGIRQIRLPP